MSQGVEEKLTDEHDLDGFTSGKTVLDDWLRRNARTAMRKGLCVVYILHDNGTAIGYFALAPHVIVREHVPHRLSRGDPDSIPAILLARLAVDQRHQGKGLGKALLVEALTRAVRAAALAGGRYIVIDALDSDAAAFYAHFDFVSTPSDELRLVSRISDVARAVVR